MSSQGYPFKWKPVLKWMSGVAMKQEAGKQQNTGVTWGSGGPSKQPWP